MIDDFPFFSLSNIFCLNSCYFLGFFNMSVTGFKEDDITFGMFVCFIYLLKVSSYMIFAYKFFFFLVVSSALCDILR